jgi:hypothetical protein
MGYVDVMSDGVMQTRRARLLARLGLPGLAVLRGAISKDFRSAAWAQRISLAGVVLWLLYEWGPGNETVTPWILANIIEDNTGAAVIPITAAVGFVFTTAQQLASGFTALAGFSLFERTSRAAWEKLRGTDEVGPGEWHGLNWSTRCSLVFGLGTTAIALIQVMTTGEVGVRRHARVVRTSAFLCGLIVAIIGAGAASIAYVGRRVHALMGTTDWIIRVLGNPLFWIGALVCLALYKTLARRTPTGEVAAST